MRPRTARSESAGSPTDGPPGIPPRQGGEIVARDIGREQAGRLQGVEAMMAEKPLMGDCLLPVAVHDLRKTLPVHVDDAGVGLVADAPAVLLRPPGPGDVLQPGQLLVVTLPRPQGSAHRAVGVVAEGMLLVRVRAGREQAAHDLALREGALLVAGLAAIDQRHAVIGLQRRRQALEPALVAGIDMGAGEHEQLPRSGVAAGIERPPEGEAGRFDGDDARAGLFGDRHRPVAGAGID